MTAHIHNPALQLRHPHRISITLPQLVFDALIARSLREGRSLSNLGAYLLEWSLRHEAEDHCSSAAHGEGRY